MAAAGFLIQILTGAPFDLFGIFLLQYCNAPLAPFSHICSSDCWHWEVLIVFINAMGAKTCTSLPLSPLYQLTGCTSLLESSHERGFYIYIIFLDFTTSSIVLHCVPSGPIPLPLNFKNILLCSGGKERGKGFI